MTFTKSFAAVLLDLVYPPRCPCCGELEADAEPCALCALELSERSVDGLLPSVGACQAVAAAFHYEGAARSMLLRYKSGLRGIADHLAPHLAVAVRRRLAGVTFACCTCVPSGRLSTKERGFSASEELALRVAALLDLPFVPLLVSRGGLAQKRLDRAARYRNVAHRITLLEGTTLKGNILLLDDIMTTGATLGHCSTLLQQAGADQIFAAVACYEELQPRTAMTADHPNK